MSNLLRKLMGFTMMDQAGAEGGAGGGGEAGAEGGEAAAGAGDNFMRSVMSGDEAGGDGEGDAGAAGGDQTPEQIALNAAEKDVRRPKGVPAKFWNAEKGEVNFEAWSKSTNELENRMRVVGLPPKTAEEYKFDVPEDIRKLGVDADPAQTKAFRDKALSMGLTQKQYEGIMAEYYQMIPQIAGASENFGSARCGEALKAFYKTDEAVKDSVKAAYQTFAAYADEEEMKAIDSLGNNPYFVRVLAKINREMVEDPGVRDGAMASAADIEELMAKGSPYWDASNPQHKSVKAKVTAHFERQAKQAQRKRAA